MPKPEILTVLSIEEEGSRSIDLWECPSVDLVDKCSFFANPIFEASFSQPKFRFSFKDTNIICVSNRLIERLLGLKKLGYILIYRLRMIVTQLCIELARSTLRTFMKARGIYAWLILCLHVRWSSLAVTTLLITQSRHTQCSVTLLDPHQSVGVWDIRWRFWVVFSSFHSTDVF